jgi:poly(A) polymerase
LSDTESQPSPGPKIIPRSGHAISRADISNSALKVLYRLDKAGYQAFIVGGGVRDLLLGLRPKDFDVATDARPEQVRQLFGNSRLIGRRFKLAHVRFGREVVEVVTFRGASTAENAEHQQTDAGRILRDNVYGAIEEDVWRRDFTVNALYYNIADFTVWDYTTGLADVASRTLRLIGEPETRYREDPVRMLRAVRLAAKLDFDIAPETAEPIERLGGLLREVPPARLFEETLKLFQAGHAVRTFELLMKYGLLRYLFPYTADAIAGDASDGVLRLIRSGLENTDRRVRSEQSVTPMFLYAVMLWHAIRAEATRIEAQDGCSETEALLRASDTIVSGQQRYTAFPKRFSLPMKDILVMQQKFTSRRGARAHRLLEHKRFRAAYDFLLLRAQCGEVDAELATWWSEVQAMPEQEQRKAFDVKRARRRRSRRRSGRRDAQASPTS